MGKDPAFLWYPNDYIGGTMGMTFEEKGAYVDLLMMQFNRGHMTEDMIGQTVGQLWDKIRLKFAQDEEGLWYNVRLEDEKLKRKNFVKSRSNNKLGKNQYSKKDSKKSGHTTSHMEDVNENTNNLNNESNKTNSDIPPSDPFFTETESEVGQICDYLKKIWKATETHQKNHDRVVELITYRSKDKIITAIDNALIKIDSEVGGRQYRPAFKEYFIKPSDIDEHQERPVIAPKSSEGGNLDIDKIAKEVREKMERKKNVKN